MEHEVLFNPSATQQTFIDAVFSKQYKYLLFGGAVGGGKTYCALGVIILLCKVYPGSRWFVVRDSLQNLKLTTIPSFLKLCPTNFLDRFNQDTMTATMTNGSAIVFFGEQYADDKELLRWRGVETNGFVFEECGELQEKTFYKGIERAGRWIPPNGNTPPPLIMMTCNPSKNWVKKLFYDRWVAGTLPGDWLFVPSKITDNPYVSGNADYMDSLKYMPTFEYNTMVLGDWELINKTGGEFYTGFDIEKHTADVKYDPMLPLILSWDENVSPYLSCIVGQVKSTNTAGKVTNELSILDEVLGSDPNNTVEAVCKMILERFPANKHKSTVELYGDATSNKQDTKLEKGANFFSLVLGFLRAYKITNRVSKSNESVSMRGSWMNSVFEKETGGIRFIVNKKCKTVISDLMMVKKNADGSKFKEMKADPKTKVRSQAVGHTSDCIDYLMTGVFLDGYSRYKSGGGKWRPPTTGKNLSRNSF